MDFWLASTLFQALLKRGSRGPDEGDKAQPRDDGHPQPKDGEKARPKDEGHHQGHHPGDPRGHPTKGEGHHQPKDEGHPPGPRQGHHPGDPQGHHHHHVEPQGQPLPVPGAPPDAPGEPRGRRQGVPQGHPRVDPEGHPPGAQERYGQKRTAEAMESGVGKKRRAFPQPGGVRARWAPIEVWYKGRARRAADGLGLNSPGIRPSGHRGAPRSSAAVKLQETFWQEVMGFVNGMDKRARLRMISELALGRFSSSPFQGFVAGLKALDSFGVAPQRKPGDRRSEIHFRRLRAWAEVVQDPDSKFLEGMASTGVPLGTRGEIPWVSAVYDKRERKGSEDPAARWEETDFQEYRGNYTSAKDHMEKVRSHVESDLEKGWMVKVTLEEARRKYGDELQVASLRAVPKDPQWSDVRVVHDGTHGLRVNTHLDQPNKMVFPQYDDLEAVLREFQKEAGPRRFTLAFDVKAAHRLIPVQERDWGLQACRLDKEEEVFLNTRGTFGVASAAFWRGRLAGLLFRVFHQVLPQEASLYLMLFADDGLLLTSGEDCHALVFALFIYLEVMEVPLSWPKTRGGLETEWIGYTIDLRNWTLGVSQRKVEWLNTWGKWAVSEGRMLGREFKAGLGRMGFLAGAIKVARPFLAPLYAAVARVPGGAFFELRMAVKLAIAFFQEMVEKAPMKALSIPPKVLGEIFRVDAMADDNGIAIGGWETYNTSATQQARWFHVKLTRKNAPYLYMKGEPFRTISTSELLAVTVAIMVFGPSASWRLRTT